MNPQEFEKWKEESNGSKNILWDAGAYATYDLLSKEIEFQRSEYERYKIIDNEFNDKQDKEIESLSKERDYWKQRCEAAEEILIEENNKRWLNIKDNQL
jgi:hypothetical protein